jgi:Galactose oxidase, central domain
MRMTGRGLVWGLGGRRWLTAVVAVLGVCGFSGVLPSAAQAGSAQVPDWTRQPTAIHPSGRFGAAMAYDAATGTVVMFGGGQKSDGTWTWDGSAWTRQHLATSPPQGLSAPSMVYDAATGTVVLFGGRTLTGVSYGGTWTWDGSAWTRQHPATSPPARFAAVMAYDAATGNVVLFGGCCQPGGGSLGDTWVWNGTTWTRQHPATRPPARDAAVMAYDRATGNVVLFGGCCFLDDTWTWDGTTWTQQHPATSPAFREYAAMAYDPATGNMVMFGGTKGGATKVVNGTWVWNGTTWTLQHPATSPTPRAGAAMAYDAAVGNMVMFGGTNKRDFYADGTWTWG